MNINIFFFYENRKLLLKARRAIKLVTLKSKG